jgi:hypothetical protein
MANLIGTDPNQVPTNGDLGTMAFQDADSAHLKNLTVDGVTGVRLGTTKRFSFHPDTLLTGESLEVTFGGFSSYNSIIIEVKFIGATSSAVAANGMCVAHKNFYISFAQNTLEYSLTNDVLLRQFVTGDITLAAVGSDYQLKLAIANPLGSSMNMNQSLEITVHSEKDPYIESINIA